MDPNPNRIRDPKIDDLLSHVRMDAPDGARAVGETITVGTQDGQRVTYPVLTGLAVLLGQVIGGQVAILTELQTLNRNIAELRSHPMLGGRFRPSRPKDA